MPDPTDNVQTPTTPRRGIVRMFTDWLVERFMPDDMGARDRQTWLERRFQSAMLSIMTAAVVWVVSSLASLNTSQQKNEIRLQNIEIQVQGAYRADIAERDINELRAMGAARDARDVVHDERITRIEHRMDRTEYVLEVAPATAPFVRRSRTRKALPEQGK